MTIHFGAALRFRFVTPDGQAASSSESLQLGRPLLKTLAGKLEAPLAGLSLQSGGIVLYTDDATSPDATMLDAVSDLNDKVFASGSEMYNQTQGMRQIASDLRHTVAPHLERTQNLISRSLSEIRSWWDGHVTMLRQSNFTGMAFGPSLPSDPQIDFHKNYLLETARNIDTMVEHISTKKYSSISEASEIKRNATEKLVNRAEKLPAIEIPAQRQDGKLVLSDNAVEDILAQLRTASA